MDGTHAASWQQNRRRTPTRQALIDAFGALFVEKGYSAVTIGAVVTAAGVGRSTFYEHFKSKSDLLAQSLAGPFGTLAATVETNCQPAECIDLLHHFRAQRRYGRVLFAGSTRQLITRRLAQLMEQRISAGDHTVGQPARLPRNMLAFQMAGSHLALIEGWLWGGMLWSVEALADALIRSARIAVLAAQEDT